MSRNKHEDRSAAEFHSRKQKITPVKKLTGSEAKKALKSYEKAFPEVVNPTNRPLLKWRVGVVRNDTTRSYLKELRRQFPHYTFTYERDDSYALDNVFEIYCQCLLNEHDILDVINKATLLGVITLQPTH